MSKYEESLEEQNERLRKQLEATEKRLDASEESKKALRYYFEGMKIRYIEALEDLFYYNPDANENELDSRQFLAASLICMHQDYHNGMENPPWKPEKGKKK